MSWTFYNSNGESLVQHAESEATQAEMEAQTAVAKFVPPDLVKNSPGVAKAWIQFNGESTVAINNSYNIANLTDNGTGDYTVTITTDMSGTDFCLIGMSKNNAVAAQRGNTHTNTVAAGSFSVLTTVEDGTTGVSDLTNNRHIGVAYFGDQ